MKGSNQTDQAILDALVTENATPPSNIRARESVSMRLAVLAGFPVWFGAIVAAVTMRLARRRLPAVVLHARVGYRRRPLLVPKIATGSVDSNQRILGGLIEVATGAPVELTVDEPRDRWLRSTGIDELPQLLLVLAGKMRVVGPRPVTNAELSEMGTGEMAVDRLHPGLVGLWQVLDRHSYELRERGALDGLMVANWSHRLRRDLVWLSTRQIIGRVRRGTMPAVSSKQRAPKPARPASGAGLHE